VLKDLATTFHVQLTPTEPEGISPPG
jgi:hypothetical protein